MTRVLALADPSKIGCITQRRYTKVGTKTHPQRGAALDRNGLSVSTETACRFEPKSPVGNSEICNLGRHRSRVQVVDDPYPGRLVDDQLMRRGEDAVPLGRDERLLRLRQRFVDLFNQASPAA